MERQCWKNEQYLRQECIEILGIPDITIDTKVSELIETGTSISINPDSLEACHRLPLNQNDKLIIEFPRRKGAEMVLSIKAKVWVSILAALPLKVLKSLSMKVFAATISSYRVNAKLYGQRNRLKLSGLAMAKKYQN